LTPSKQAGEPRSVSAAGASQKILADQAMEMLFRGSRGVLRVASKALRTGIRMAADRGQSFLDEPVIQAALDELGVGT
jgi:Holliday junction resolvasome RuvABC ATP-dependent DNA helicase subunit